jgi:hypothetical protein
MEIIKRFLNNELSMFANGRLLISSWIMKNNISPNKKRLDSQNLNKTTKARY